MTSLGLHLREFLLFPGTPELYPPRREHLGGELYFSAAFSFVFRASCFKVQVLKTRYEPYKPQRKTQTYFCRKILKYEPVMPRNLGASVGCGETVTG